MVLNVCFNQKEKLILVHPNLVVTFIHGKKIGFTTYKVSWKVLSKICSGVKVSHS